MNQKPCDFDDRKIKCLDCGKPFTFTAGEQMYYYGKQLQTPKRCPACREIRRLTIMPRGQQ